MKNLLLTMLLVTFFRPTSQLWADATGNSNSGDGVIIAGEAVLRDLMPNGELHLSNEEFLQSVPGFMDMLRNLYKANSRLALSIYKDLLDEEIWLMPGNLPDFPDYYIPYVDERTRVTFALRRPDNGDGAGDILISRRAYNRLADTSKKCLLVHESLHAHRNVNVDPISAATHHLYVRQLTRLICENNGNVSSEVLSEAMNRLNFSDDKLIAKNKRLHQNIPRGVYSFSKSLEKATVRYNSPEQLCGLLIPMNVVSDYSETDTAYRQQITYIKKLFNLTSEQCAPYIASSKETALNLLISEFPLLAKHAYLLRSDDLDAVDLSLIAELPEFFSARVANVHLHTYCHSTDSYGRFPRTDDNTFRNCFTLSESRERMISDRYSMWRRVNRKIRSAREELLSLIKRSWRNRVGIQRVCVNQYLNGNAEVLLDAFKAQARAEISKLNALYRSKTYDSYLVKLYIGDVIVGYSDVVVGNSVGYRIDYFSDAKLPEFNQVLYEVSTRTAERLSFCQSAHAIANNENVD